MARQFSDYCCPNCGHRLTYAHSRGQDLFCVSCYAAVCLVDEDYFLYILADQLSGLQVGQIADLMPPA